jgi:hypothetical protein
MKPTKNYIFFIAIALFAIFLWLWVFPIVPPSDNPNGALIAGPPCIMVDGAVYRVLGGLSKDTPQWYQISGFISSTLNDLSIKPYRNGQTNFNCLFAPYAWINGTLVLYHSGTWIVCIP